MTNETKVKVARRRMCGSYRCGKIFDVGDMNARRYRYCSLNCAAFPHPVPRGVKLPTMRELAVLDSPSIS